MFSVQQPFERYKFTLFVRSWNFLRRSIDVVLAATIVRRSVKVVNYCGV
jgi:hypothetical protein